MINNISKLFILSISILSATLITGPAIPDLITTFSGIFFLFYLYYTNQYKKIFKEKIFIISILFWFYLLIVSIFAENKLLSFSDSLVFIRILILPISIYFWVTLDRKDLNNILLVIFLCVVFVIIDTLFQFTQYNSEFGFGRDLLGFKSNWYGRLTGPFGNELIPGAYLSKFSFLGLSFLLIITKQNKFKNIICVFYLSILGLTIFASGERMALATYGMGLFFLLIFFKNRSIFIISILVTITLILVIKNFHPSYNDFNIIESTPYHLGLKVEKNFKCNNDKLSKCTKIINLQPSFIKVLKNFNKTSYGEIYKLSFEMFKNNVLVGVGLNNFTHLCQNDLKYKKIITNYVCASHPHNFYIQWLVEAGVIGFFIFIVYLSYLSYFILIKNYNEYSLFSFATILVLFWPIMSTGSLLKNWNGIITFFIIGISLALTKIKK